MPVTVVTAPSPIAGSSTVCVGSTTLYTDGIGGGTWTSSNPLFATIGSSTGLVTGVAPGVVTITYSLGSCTATKVLTVNASPGAISGASTDCAGSSIILTDPTSGGTWSSSFTPAGTISTTGVVSGLSAGVTTITYMLPDGCYSIHPVTVNPLPGAISGVSSICVGEVTFLFATGGPGTWSSSAPLVASVGATTGIVTGLSAGVTTIIFTLPTGCLTSTIFTVNPVPLPIGGPLTVCIGSTVLSTDATPGGFWTSSASLTDSIDFVSGLDSGISAGVATISYTVGSCSAIANVTVNPLPFPISGADSVCVGSTINLFDFGGGTWSSSDITKATVGAATGVVTGVSAGVVLISYTLGSTGCSAVYPVTVNALPSAISGTSVLCVGQTALQTDATPGGTWVSSTPFIATISGTGLVTAMGIGVDTIKYIGAGGCMAIKTVTVNSSPGPITGLNHVCIGSTIVLTDAGGGTWASSDVTRATVGSTTGMVTGVAAGVVTITYSLGAGCFTTMSLTVNPLPGLISGPTHVCVGSCITLTDGAGTWSTTSTPATVGSSTGVVCGVTTGIATITFTLTATGCTRTTPITVNPSPAAFAVTGGGNMCSGGTGMHIGLSGSTTGVAYQLYLGGIAVGLPVAGTGTSLDFGVFTTAGTYTVVATSTTTLCSINMTGSAIITISPLPPLWGISGGGSICIGSLGLHIGLLGSTPGVSYQLMNGVTAVGAPLMGTGLALDFGLQSAAGTYTVVGTYVSTGCFRTMTGTATLIVNPAPLPIGGPSALCPGTTITLTDVSGPGTWVSGSPGVAPIGGTTGIVTGLMPGITMITYTITGTGCSISTMVTVSPIPGPILGPATACVGLTSTYTDAAPGGTWSSSTPAVATIGSLSGILSGITPGTTLLTYTLGGTVCTVTRTVTVNAGPSAISGPASVCVGSTITLSDVTPGGTWTSSAPLTGSVSATGIVTGVSAGIASISYAVGAGCPAILPVTVNPLPAAIAGPSVVCVGSTITETDITPGITWAILGGTATISAGTGIVTGISPGPGTVICLLSTGCQTTRAITVNPLPSAISGTAQVCVGLSATFTDATPGGTWTHTTPAVATMAPAGTFTGILPGTDTIRYTIGTGCSVTVVITVNPVPTAITGAGSICVGSTLTLSDGVGGGAWSSITPTVATVVSTSGLVTGMSSGTTLISYTAGGCAATTTVTVIAAPGPISGPTHVCVGLSITETDPTIGGIWTSSNPSVASVVPGTGVVSGIASGTIVISYALGTGCYSIYTVIVNPVSQILGTPIVCAGQTTVLYDTTLGGTWSSSAPGIALVSTSGVVTGNIAGVATISYLLPTGCSATQTVTVYPVPSAITGPSQVCAGANITLADASPLGTWSSSNPSLATVSSTGVVSGISNGTVQISYSYSTGCAATHTVTVNPIPPAITGGPATVCVGGTLALSDAITGGLWTSSSPSATIGSMSGVVTGVTPGTVTITYNLTTGCSTTTTITVDTALGAITGTANLCVGGSTTLTGSVPGGTWSCSATPVATVGLFSGVVSGLSAGTTIVTYSLGAGCTAMQAVTVNPLPAGISGSSNVCQGGTATLSDIAGPGTWSSSVPSTATIGSSTGIVTGVLPGIVTMTYTLVTGCQATTTMIVNPAPAPITGIPQVCVGMTTSLGDATPGGTWSCIGPSATIDAVGTVTGVSSGTSLVSYTGALGCAATIMVTVNNMPSLISGSSTVCQGYSTVYTNLVPGGTWSSLSPLIATAGPGGIITGLNTGVATIVYTVGAGCMQPKDITVNPTPVPVSGPNTVCATHTITLSDATPGGIWTSGTPLTATVGSGTGVVTGLAAGMVTISYSNSYGCAALQLVTVNPNPAPITGNTNVCLGSTVVLSNTVPGGIWTSSVPSVATIGSSSGLVSGLSLGTSTISYTLAAGCSESTIVHVNPLPQLFTVTGGGSYCNGGSGVHIGLTGSSVGVNYLLYRGLTATGTFAGTGAALDFGLQTVSGVYTVVATTTATGCSVSMTGTATILVIANVTPSVTVHDVPGDTVCAGTAVTFTPVPVNGGTGPVYQWQVNGINVSVSNSYTFIPADGDIVSVEMTSNATCPLPAMATGTSALHVNAWGVPSVSIAADPGTTVCQGTIVRITPTATMGGTTPVYSWMKNGAAAGISSNYVYVPVNNDQVYCIMQSSYPCRLNNTDTSATLVMTIDTPLMPVVTITANPGTLINIGQTETLTAHVVNGGTSPAYQWLRNGVPITGATDASYTSNIYGYPAADSMTVWVTSSGLCTATGYEWIYITVTPVGVQNVTGGSDLTLIPNPNKGAFMIRGTIGTGADEQLSIQVTDVLGQEVYTGTLTARKGKLNERIELSNISNGMYMVTLRTATGSQVFHMVIEQ